MAQKIPQNLLQSCPSCYRWAFRRSFWHIRSFCLKGLHPCTFDDGILLHLLPLPPARLDKLMIFHWCHSRVGGVSFSFRYCSPKSLYLYPFLFISLKSEAVLSTLEWIFFLLEVSGMIWTLEWLLGNLGRGCRIRQPEYKRRRHEYWLICSFSSHLSYWIASWQNISLPRNHTNPTHSNTTSHWYLPNQLCNWVGCATPINVHNELFQISKLWVNFNITEVKWRRTADSLCHGKFNVLFATFVTET